MKTPSFTLSFTIQRSRLVAIHHWFEKHAATLVLFLLTTFSTLGFIFYYLNGLGLAYNDARSHLDIGRRVVEGLKPGLAQLGSVWLPLPHILMAPTVWNDFMWHSGLAGAIQSMASFVATALLIYAFLRKLGIGMLGRLLAVAVFTANLNILYLQSTAMTELLLTATMLAGVYQLLMWFTADRIQNLISAGLWIMLSSLVRYEGWFLLFFASLLVIFYTWRKKGYKVTEGTYILFATLAGLGIALWLLWNALIFKDPFYFSFGPYSARAQQEQLEQAGVLATKGDLFLSLKIYLLALVYNSYAFNAFLGLLGAILFWTDKKLKTGVKVVSLLLLAPLLFNILALYLGHSVLFIQGVSGNTWFNVRYGAMMVPSIAIFMGYLVHRLKDLRWVLIGLFAFVTFFALANGDAVTIDDARVGSSQKNVSEISGYLNSHAKDEKGFILISAASHDAIIFSSGLPMKRFIHEGTGAYWESATTSPDRWARWIVARTHDDNDLTWKAVSKVPTFFEAYTLVAKYPFADVYELNPEFFGNLIKEPVLGKLK